MNPVLYDLGRSTAARSIEENLIALLKLFARLPHAELLDAPDVLRVITGIMFPFANAVCRARLANDHVDAKIDLALEPLRERKLPALWWVGPSSRPSDLGKRLVAHGLTDLDDSPGMALDLNQVNRKVHWPENLSIRRVSDRDSLRDYVVAMLHGFEMEAVAGELMEQVITVAGFGDAAPWRSFLAYLDGKPVGTCSVLWGGGVAGLYNISTIAEVRGHGVGSAVTLAALDDSLAHGYRMAVLESSSEAVSMYTRLGFAECCKFGCYQLPA